MEKSRKALQVRLDKLNDQSRKDNVVTFEQLGVDRLFVDESHNYKNLFLYTKMRNVAGIAQNDTETFYQTLGNLVNAPSYLWLLMGIAFTLDVILSIALSAAIQAYVKGVASYMTGCYVAIIQFASYISFQIFDYRSPVSIIVCFVIKMVIDIAAIAYVFKVVVREMNYAND